MKELASRTCPNAGVSVGGTSSSPVESTTTRGRGWTSGVGCPALASSPSSGAPRRFPLVISTSPSCTSSPRGRTCVPGAGPSSNRTSSSPSTSAFSIGTITSAPAGTGAPVAMCIVSPAPTVPSGSWPINARPTIFSSRGCAGVAPATSDARTANPSIAEEANSGRSCVGERRPRRPRTRTRRSEGVGAERVVGRWRGRAPAPPRRRAAPREHRGRGRGLRRHRGSV